MNPSRLAALLIAGAPALVLTIALLGNGDSGVASAGALPVGTGGLAGADGTAEVVPGELIVHFDPSVRQVSRAASIRSAGASIERDLRVPGYTLVRVTAGDEVSAAERLSAQPGVTSVEPNYLHHIAFVPDDEHYDLQWNLPQIGMEQAWEKTNGAGVTVAVLDTGVAYEDCSVVVCGTQFYKAPDFGSATFVSPRDIVSSDSHPNDSHGHGTHVASTIAESTNNGIGAAGIAYGASVMPVRVCGIDGGCSTADVADGIDYAVDNGAQVINLSLGGSGASQSELAAVNSAVAQGVVVVAASGNGGDDHTGDAVLNCPACFPSSIAVGATRYDMDRTSYSNYGTGMGGHTLDIVAPGGASGDQNGDTYPDGILQQTFQHACNGSFDLSDFTYCFYNGTSMATPHIVGVIALMLSVNPALTPAQVRSILGDTATDLGSPGYDLEYGWGLVNAVAAVNEAQDTVGGTPTPTDTPVATNTPAPTPTPTATFTPTTTATPTGMPTSTPSATPTGTPTSTPSPTPTRTPTPTPTRTPTPACAFGDVNRSGSTNSIDAALVLQLSANLIAAVACPPAADVNEDAVANALDSALILQFAAGLISSLPV